MKDEVIIRIGWGTSEIEGTWTEDEGRRVCFLCRKMIRPGERVIEYKGRGVRWSYCHKDECSNQKEVEG